MLRTDIIAGNGQALPDLAIQENGTLEGLFELAAANDKSITALLSAGEVLSVAGTQSREVKAYYAANRLKPASESGVGVGVWVIGDDEIGGGTSDGEGVGFWFIEDDFIVT